MLSLIAVSPGITIQVVLATSESAKGGTFFFFGGNNSTPNKELTRTEKQVEIPLIFGYRSHNCCQYAPFYFIWILSVLSAVL